MSRPTFCWLPATMVVLYLSRQIWCGVQCTNTASFFFNLFSHTVVFKLYVVKASPCTALLYALSIYVCITPTSSAPRLDQSKSKILVSPLPLFPSMWPPLSACRSLIIVLNSLSVSGHLTCTYLLVTFWYLDKLPLSSMRTMFHCVIPFFLILQLMV